MFLEQDLTNNTAWVRFTLSVGLEREPQGVGHGDVAVLGRALRRPLDESVAALGRACRVTAAGSSPAPQICGMATELTSLGTRRTARARAREDREPLMRERWFGSTGRKVPEVVLEGTLELDGALILDDVSDIERIRTAHLEGMPVVVRAKTAEDVVGALSRGEVACVLVSDKALLELDLAGLTYG